jgi:hypothetical protein
LAHQAHHSTMTPMWDGTAIDELEYRRHREALRG